MDIVNPVEEFYPNYVFPTTDIVEFNSYTDVLAAAKNATRSCILINKNPQVLNDASQIDVDLNYDLSLNIHLVLNLTLTGKSWMYITGSNYNITNVNFKDADEDSSYPTHLVRVSGSKISVINFSFDRFFTGNDDLDYFRNTSEKGNKVINCLFNGKKNNGIFLRSDNPFDFEVFQCVFLDHDKGSDSNGGEAIRIATSSKENVDTNATISSCYFNNCVSDPEIVSIKSSSNILKRIVVENCSGKKVVFRHGHRNSVENSFFSESGLRVYGKEHEFNNLQLVKGSDLHLDDKSGSGYVLPEDCLVNNIFYQDTTNPVKDEGRNNIVTNVIEKLAFTAEDLLNGNNEPSFEIQTQSGRTVKNKEVYIDEEFSIEYKTDLIQTYNFILSNATTSEIIHEQTESNSPYWLYGDVNGLPLYNSINDAGVYNLKIEQTGQVFTFDVVIPEPPVSNTIFKIYTKEGREVDMSDPKIFVGEEYTVEYITPILQPYNFNLIENSSGNTIYSKTENKEPYFMYGNRGDEIYYNYLDRVGTYVVRIQETGDELVFNVIEEKPVTHDILLPDCTQIQIDLIKEQVDTFSGQDLYQLLLKKLRLDQLESLKTQIDNLL